MISLGIAIFLVLNVICGIRSFFFEISIERPLGEDKLGQVSLHKTLHQDHFIICSSDA